MKESPVRLAASAEPPSDSELMAAIALGNLGPLGELFDRHHASVRAFATRVLANPSDTDDLVQETFLTASRAAVSFETGASARPFLLGVAAQLVRRNRRSFQRLRAMLGSFGVAPSPSPPSPEDQTARGQEAARLHAAIARLSLEHRLVIGMVELEGLSGVEAARALDVPVGTVWRRLHEAREELRKRLFRRGK